MITVTEEAKDLFLSVDYPDDTVLRLDPMVDQNTGETQIGISAGEPKSDDQVVEHDGEAVLHIAGLLSQALDGSTLDAVDTPQGPGIGITTPDSTPLTDDS
jgi:iron-sulfur cluster assembly protein